MIYLDTLIKLKIQIPRPSSDEVPNSQQQTKSSKLSMANTRYTLQNARVFDGQIIGEPSTVYISDGYIVASPSPEAQVIDCNNDILLSGFIDAHVHTPSEETLKQLSSYGITTALDMANWPPSLVDSFRSLPGFTDILSAGVPATAPGSRHSHIPDLPLTAQISTEQQAIDFVDDRIEEGSDYIKIVVDIPGPSQEIVNTIAKASREKGKLSVAHASSTAAFAMAQEANVDIITHIPLDAVLNDTMIQRMHAAGTISIPTLTMMEGIANNIPNTANNYTNAKQSVTAMLKAGIEILVGTDANATPGLPFCPDFGDSMHHEMELLVQAGMSNVQTLRAATSEVARVFGLGDRGTVEVGKKANLVLLGGDPTVDIRATRNVKRVWCRGVEVELSK